jgi:hypothetical protein
MTSFTTSALMGLCIGFLWGIGCSLAILYSIYLAGYRKAIEESMAAEKPPRFRRVIEKIRMSKADNAGKS